MLYIAYGSNLHEGQMLRRAPGAVRIGKMVVPNWRLVFRLHADIEPHEGATLHAGLWTITPADEAALDRYEGVGGGYYRKEYWPLSIKRDGKETVKDALVYLMNRKDYQAPDRFYYDTIRIGYFNFGLPETALEAAAEMSEEADRAERRFYARARAGKVKAGKVTA